MKRLRIMISLAMVMGLWNVPVHALDGEEDTQGTQPQTVETTLDVTTANDDGNASAENGNTTSVAVNDGTEGNDETGSDYEDAGEKKEEDTQNQNLNEESGTKENATEGASTENSSEKEISGNQATAEEKENKTETSAQSQSNLVMDQAPAQPTEESMEESEPMMLMSVNEASGTSFSLNDAIANAKNGATIDLTGDIFEDVVIPEGKTITINLNGHNITSKSDHAITNKGNLTITGKGTVDGTVHARAALVNEPGATAVIEGGTFTRSKENGSSATDNGGNSYYAIRNHGTMTINDATVTQNGYYSSLVENGYQNGNTEGSNDCILTINGGTFTGGINTIKNDDRGVVTITDGTFTNQTQYALMNWNEATISGGDFTGTGFSVVSYHADSGFNKGITRIDGGEFKQAIGRNATGSYLITNGTFAAQPKDEYIVAGYESKKDEENGVFTIVRKTETPAEAVAPTVAEPSANTTGKTDEQAQAIERAADQIKDAADKVTAQGLAQQVVNNAIASGNDDAVQSVKIGENDVKSVSKVIEEAKATDGAPESISKATVPLVLAPQAEIRIQVNDIQNDTITGKKLLDLEIDAYCQMYVTTGDVVTEKKQITNENAVAVGEAYKANINDDVTLTIPLPTGFIEGDDASKVYVRHTHDGVTEIVKGTINEDGTLSFTVHGMSPMRVYTDARSATVKFQADASETSETLTPDKTNKTLPTLAKAGYTFKGWQMTNEDDGSVLDEIYATLSDTLLTKLNRETWIARPVYEKNAEEKTAAGTKTSAYDDGSPFTHETNGDVKDRWGNVIYKAPATSGYRLVDTGVKD